MSEPFLTDNDRITLAAELQLDYELEGKYKSLEVYAEKFSKDPEEMRQCFQLLTEAISHRGLPQPDFLKEDPDDQFLRDSTRPDPTFLMVAQSILDTNDTRSTAAKLKEFKPLGITSKTWTNWMKDPVNSNYFDAQLEDRLNKDIIRAGDLALGRNVASGDLSSIKFVNELTGRYRPQTENVQNFGILMQMVMGILARTLTPDQLDTVADELETLPIYQRDGIIEVRELTETVND